MIPDQYCWYHKGFFAWKETRGGRRRREKNEKD
jgi:hypothetical protein